VHEVRTQLQQERVRADGGGHLAGGLDGDAALFCEGRSVSVASSAVLEGAAGTPLEDIAASVRTDPAGFMREAHGLSAFALSEGVVYHTYSTLRVRPRVPLGLLSDARQGAPGTKRGRLGWRPTGDGPIARRLVRPPRRVQRRRRHRLTAPTKSATLRRAPAGARPECRHGRARSRLRAGLPSTLGGPAPLFVWLVSAPTPVASQGPGTARG
jgi:hypothetical protein